MLLKWSKYETNCLFCSTPCYNITDETIKWWCYKCKRYFHKRIQGVRGKVWTKDEDGYVDTTNCNQCYGEIK